MNFVLAHVFFVLAISLFVTAMFQKSRKSFLFVLVACDLSFSFYYLFLDRLTPVLLNFFEAILVTCLYFIEKHQKSHKFVLVAVALTFVVYVLAGVLTWAGPLQLLSLFASSMFLLGLAIHKLVVTKALDILSVTAATTYWFCVASIFTGVVGICLWIGAWCGFLRTVFFETKKRKLTKQHAKIVEQKTTVVKKQIT